MKFDEIDREANIALSTAGRARLRRPSGEGLSCRRLRDSLHHALVGPSFGASREVKRECGKARDRPSRCCPRNCRRIVLDHDVTERREAASGRRSRALSVSQETGRKTLNQLVRRWVEERGSAHHSRSVAELGLIGGAVPPIPNPVAAVSSSPSRCPQPEPSRWRGRALVSSFILLSKANANQSVVR